MTTKEKGARRGKAAQDLIRKLPQRYEEDVPLSTLVEYPTNAKDHDIGAITESMQENGWYGAILCQEWPGVPRYILAGHGRKKTLLAAGMKTAPVMWLECDPDTAAKIVLGDNRTTILGGWQDDLLSAELTRVSMMTGGLRGTGFTLEDRDELEALLAGPEVAPEDEPPDMDLLQKLRLSTGEPKHQVKRGEAWELDGQHIVVCCDLAREWEQFTRYLEPGSILVVYPSPFVVLSKTAKHYKLVLAQPDEFLAGWTLDHYASVRGSKSVKMLTHKTGPEA